MCISRAGGLSANCGQGLLVNGRMLGGSVWRGNLSPSWDWLVVLDVVVVLNCCNLNCCESAQTRPQSRTNTILTILTAGVCTRPLQADGSKTIFGAAADAVTLCSATLLHSAVLLHNRTFAARQRHTAPSGSLISASTWDTHRPQPTREYPVCRCRQRISLLLPVVSYAVGCAGLQRQGTAAAASALHTWLSPPCWLGYQRPGSVLEQELVPQHSYDLCRQGHSTVTLVSPCVCGDLATGCVLRPGVGFRQTLRKLTLQCVLLLLPASALLWLPPVLLLSPCCTVSRMAMGFLSGTRLPSMMW